MAFPKFRDRLPNEREVLMFVTSDAVLPSIIPCIILLIPSYPSSRLIPVSEAGCHFCFRIKLIVDKKSGTAYPCKTVETNLDRIFG